MKLLVTICSFIVVQAVAQVPVRKDDKLQRNFVQPAPRIEEQREGVSELLQELEKHIAEGAVKPLIGYIGSQIYLDLGSGGHGYFSSNQALSLLESYFIQRKPVSFKFVNVNQRAPSPFATGKLEYVYKGNKESAQVYVALTEKDSLWVMTQITIY